MLIFETKTSQLKRIWEVIRRKFLFTGNPFTGNFKPDTLYWFELQYESYMCLESQKVALIKFTCFVQKDVLSELIQNRVAIFI